MSEENKQPAPQEAIDALLAFLPAFEAESFQVGEWQTPEGQFPYFVYAGKVNEFKRVLRAHGWSASFDWTVWQQTADEYIKSPAKVATADLETIQRLFTTHVRKDRFAEGHLAAMFRNGHIVALLRRLKELQ